MSNDGDVRAAMARERFSTILAVAFGLIALVLCVAGLYGVTSYVTTKRVPEMGVRLALGARPFDVLLLVVGDAARTIIAGIVLGLCVGAFVLRWLSSMLFGVTPLDMVTVTAASVMIGAVGLLAVLIPARRASRTDPVRALRAE